MLTMRSPKQLLKGRFSSEELKAGVIFKWLFICRGAWPIHNNSDQRLSTSLSDHRNVMFQLNSRIPLVRASSELSVNWSLNGHPFARNHEGEAKAIHKSLRMGLYLSTETNLIVYYWSVEFMKIALDTEYFI